MPCSFSEKKMYSQTDKGLGIGSQRYNQAAEIEALVMVKQKYE